MQFKHLSQKFFDDYPQDQYPELMTKENRPYTLTVIDIDDLKFAIPLRSNISHNYDVLWTNKSKRCGLDFTKAILILNDDYIDNESKPHIRKDEFSHLIGKEIRVRDKMKKSISNYIKAKSDLSKEHNKLYCDFSSLQYFEKYIYNNQE